MREYRHGERPGIPVDQALRNRRDAWHRLGLPVRQPRHWTSAGESVVDVAVQLDWAAYPDPQRRFDARLRLSAEVTRGTGRPDVDLVMLNDAPPHVARAIVTRGRRVFCLDAEADHAFVRTALLRGADLEPFLRRARRVKLAHSGRQRISVSSRWGWGRGPAE